MNFDAAAQEWQTHGFGFPPPGHPYWTEATLTGTAQRYPGLNITPWRSAMCGARP
jgi:hypothetical protein